MVSNKEILNGILNLREQLNSLLMLVDAWNRSIHADIYTINKWIERSEKEKTTPGVAEKTCHNVFDGWCTNGFYCSECGNEISDCEGYHVTGTWNYCSKCGAKVVK